MNNDVLQDTSKFSRDSANGYEVLRCARCAWNTVNYPNEGEQLARSHALYAHPEAEAVDPAPRGSFVNGSWELDPQEADGTQLETRAKPKKADATPPPSAQSDAAARSANVSAASDA